MKKQYLLIGLIFALLAGGAAIVHHMHGGIGGHDHDGSDKQLQLNAGRKWETDTPLRQGMGRIRDLVTTAGTDVSEAGMRSLVKGVREQVDYLVTNCKLTPKADASLHVVLADLLNGAELVTQDEVSRGITLMRTALDMYPKYFDHPGWDYHGNASP